MAVSAQINEFQPVEFQGGEKNILYRLTCQGVGKPYAFPPPKQEKWIALPVFRPYSNELLPIIEEYQPVADKLLVTVVSGNNLHKAGTFGKFLFYFFQKKETKFGITKVVLLVPMWL